MYEGDDCERITVAPPLSGVEVTLVGGLAGVGDGPRRVWPGQPSRRSPWLPCIDGCCLVLETRPHLGTGADPPEWLRFLIREVLVPRSAAARARAEQLGLPGGHRLGGRVLLDVDRDRPVLVVVSSNRVREVPLDEDLFPVEPTAGRDRARGPGEVVSLDRTTKKKGDGHRADR